MFTDGPFWPSLLWVLPLLLIGAVWLAVAVLVNRGEDVDRPNRMAHLYGYTVCMIGLVVGLITLSSILGATFDRANPLQSDNPFGTSLASFESYKATYRREQAVFERGEVAKKDSLSEAALRTRYERSEEHTSELQSRLHLVCRLLLEKKKMTSLETPHSTDQT